MILYSLVCVVTSGFTAYSLFFGKDSIDPTDEHSIDSAGSDIFVVLPIIVLIVWAPIVSQLTVDNDISILNMALLIFIVILTLIAYFVFTMVTFNSAAAEYNVGLVLCGAACIGSLMLFCYHVFGLPYDEMLLSVMDRLQEP